MKIFTDQPHYYKSHKANAFGLLVTLIYPSVLLIEKVKIFLLLTAVQVLIVIGLFIDPIISLLLHSLLFLTLIAYTLKQNL
ncbi:MAG: hypothetical protein IBX48_08085 [Thiomicrospira sp.]|uniref:hypothetical protein n=1 Tax=Thiomicrospira sp. TaxID=935 RepID=UPI001A02B956|nr:hypothetical protein [Thiomicrospira sp.]MBE0494289.1 hypothetical protein [Thiomicrospira sp.]